MMAAAKYIGTWEIVECKYTDGNGKEDRLEGTKFFLDDFGDLSWFTPNSLTKSDVKIKERDELRNPLFSCDTFEIYCTCDEVVLRLGTYSGHIIEFKADLVHSGQLLVLTCESWCILRCEKRPTHYDLVSTDEPFTLLPALEDGFFSDATYLSINNKQFPVHTLILQMNGIQCGENGESSHSSQLQLHSLPEEILFTILHWLYSESLPYELTEETCQEVIKIASSILSLLKLANACKLYLRNMVLKQHVIGLVTDMHTYLSKCVEHFTPLRAPCPAEVCLAIKQTTRDAAVAATKLLLLCDFFTKRCCDLSRTERHEIVRYAKSRLPVFIGQIHRLLQGARSALWDMSAAQITELVHFLIPEIETILSTVTALVVDVKTALETIIEVRTNLSPADDKRPAWKTDAARSLRTALHNRELSELRIFHQKITYNLLRLHQRKDSFCEMDPTDKLRSVARNLERLSADLPAFILKLEQVTESLDEKLDWREFKFCFNVTTSKVSSVLQKLVTHRGALHDVIIQTCDLIQRDSFTQSMVSLGLTDGLPSEISRTESYSSSQHSSSSDHNTPKHHGYKLNLVESLCNPPRADRSSLVREALKLLYTQRETDMEFVIIPPKDDKVQNAGDKEANKLEKEIDQKELDPEPTVIRAHRVIVAARCDWFRRALLSGMREDIDRKIIIRDTSPIVFKRMLHFLYGERLDGASTGPESLIELLLLADRYEVDSLKKACECALITHIDEDSVICLLGMADQFNANELKSRCLTYISQHPELLDQDLFKDLPYALQSEFLVWAESGINGCSGEDRLPYPPPPAQCSPNSTNAPITPVSPISNSSSNSIVDLQDVMGSLRVGESHHGSNESFGLDAVDEDATLLEECVSQLRDIVGPGVSKEMLVQFALAADYDVNRAANFYYSNT